MSVSYTAASWNRQKRLYDLTLGGVILGLLVAWSAVILIHHPGMTAETFLLRFTSITALALLHVILAIGPLSRLDRRFLPLLYNRRHLGVTMFLFAFIHGVLAIFQFHAVGDKNPLVSLFTAYGRDYHSLVNFPFETLGFFALVIFFLMAATSHDFWLKNLSPAWWKALHLLVYLAYGLAIAHVFLGALQSEKAALYPIVLGFGFVFLTTLHLLAHRQEQRTDLQRHRAEVDGFFVATDVRELQEGQGKVVMVNGERLAVFLHQGKLFALSNVCRHQGGPLGEGRIVFGCLTCPWHGYQFHVEDGCSPPPFTEVVPTYALRLIGTTIYVNPQPLPLQTRSEGVRGETPSAVDTGSFYIGWQEQSPMRLASFLRTVVLGLGIVLSALTAALAWVQNPVDVGTFEFGQPRMIEGVLHDAPLPYVQVKAKGTAEGLNFLLVGAGKFGPPAVIHGHDGERVRFKGTLIYRQDLRMIEMTYPETFQVLGETTATEKNPPFLSLGEGTFVGELVDTKCYFGVMRPATGKVHRACAIRCLSGGAPPGLLVRDAEGNAVVLLLAGRAGKKLDYDVELAARVVKVKGLLELHSGLPVLRTSQITLK